MHCKSCGLRNHFALDCSQLPLRSLNIRFGSLSYISRTASHGAVRLTRHAREHR